MVTIKPLPHWAREVPERLRPTHQPIFDGEPTPDDIELARELWRALDPESQRWYSRGCPWLAE